MISGYDHDIGLVPNKRYLQNNITPNQIQVYESKCGGLLLNKIKIVEDIGDSDLYSCGIYSMYISTKRGSH